MKAGWSANLIGVSIKRPAPVALTAIARVAVVPIALAAMLIGSLASPASAQFSGERTGTPGQPIVIRLESPMDPGGFPENMASADGMDLLRAERSLREGDAESALRLFRALWDRDVREPRVVTGLGESLLALHRDSELDSLAAATGASDPVAGPYLQVMVGESLARNGNTDAAVERWRAAVRHAPKDARLALLETIGGYEESHALWKDLAKNWQEARSLSGKHDAYARELGEAYLADGKRVEAVTEFTALLVSSPAMFPLATARLEGLFTEDSTLRAPALKRLREALQDAPERFDLSEVVVTWSLASAECEAALAEAIRREKAAPSGGTYLLVLAESAGMTPCPDLAGRVWQEMSAMCRGKSLGVNVRFALARLLEESGKPVEAVDAYLQLARAEPGTAEASQARMRAADLMLGIPARRAEAIAILEQLGPVAAIRLPEALLVAGKLDEAKGRLDAFLGSKGIPPDGEEHARYLRASAFYFEGEFDSTRAELDRVVDLFPRGETTNDCLDMLFLLDLAESAPVELARVAAADYLAYRGELEGAAGILDAVMASPGPLAPEAAWRRAGIARRGSEPEAALGLLERVAKDGEDTLRGRALEEAAAIARDDLHDAVRARGYLERLLVEAPDGPFADRARRTLNALPRDLP